MFDAFIYGQDGSPNDFFSTLSERKYVAKNGLYGFQVICADFILVCCCGTSVHARSRAAETIFQVYRLWIVWGRSWWLCVLPAITTLSTAGKLCTSVVEESTAHAIIIDVTGAGAATVDRLMTTLPGEDAFVSRLKPTITIFFSTTLV